MKWKEAPIKYIILKSNFKKLNQEWNKPQFQRQVLCLAPRCIYNKCNLKWWDPNNHNKLNKTVDYFNQLVNLQVNRAFKVDQWLYLISPLVGVHQQVFNNRYLWYLWYWRKKSVVKKIIFLMMISNSIKIKNPKIKQKLMISNLQKKIVQTLNKSKWTIIFVWKKKKKWLFLHKWH